MVHSRQQVVVACGRGPASKNVASSNPNTSRNHTTEAEPRGIGWGQLVAGLPPPWKPMQGGGALKKARKEGGQAVDINCPRAEQPSPKSYGWCGVRPPTLILAGAGSDPPNRPSRIFEGDFQVKPFLAQLRMVEGGESTPHTRPPVQPGLPSGGTGGVTVALRLRANPPK